MKFHEKMLTDGDKGGQPGCLRHFPDLHFLSPKRVAIFQIRFARFRPLFLRMSLSRNRFLLSGDMR